MTDTKPQKFTADDRAVLFFESVSQFLYPRVMRRLYLACFGSVISV